jgi:two-component system response regulator YesN
LFKLAVVDDEYLVRQAVRFILSEKEQIQICAEAEDGEEAIKVINETQPDIVLLDIRIPDPDGIQVAKEIRKNLPDTKVVFLTAYDEFNYAQQSVKMGAYDFLLKPIEPEKIIDVISRATVDIEKERKKKSEQNKAFSQLKELRPYIETEFVYHIITDSGQTDELLREAEFIGLKDTPSVVIIACIEEIKGKTEIEKLLYYQTTVKEIKKAVAQIPSTLVAPIYNNKAIIILPDGFVSKQKKC